MAAPKLLSRFRHTRQLLSSLRRPSLPLNSRTSNPNPNPNPNASHFSAFHFHERLFSTRTNDTVPSSSFASEAPSSPDIVNFGVNEVDREILNGITGGGGEEPIIPVRVLVSLLDGYHDLTGLPWWIVIVSSTVAMRLTLFPLLVLQLKKLKKLGELLPKLPPPFPPPKSGRSFSNQFSLFLKEKRAIGCPSPLWFVAHFSVQVPLFILWLTSIRRMSLDHHPGFDSGGILWFQNLTELPSGAFGPIFPFLIAGLHYFNVQLSFEKSSERLTRIYGSFVKYYKNLLDLLTLPLIFIGFNVPLGSLVYWVTNSSLNVLQQIVLRHPVVRMKLGLQDKDSPSSAENFHEIIPPELTSVDPSGKFRKVSATDLSPKQLLQLSVQLLASGNREVAVSLLQQAIERDRDYVEALIVMAQVLLKEGHPTESSKLLDRAISKLVASHSTNLYLLILAYQWAGVACVQQGKKAEGITHLKRVASYGEPPDPKSKPHYFDSLALLAIALHKDGHQAEAAKYLDLAVAYDPAYKEFFDRCARDDMDIVSALVSSRGVQ